MKGILADNDVSGYVNLLVQIWQSPTWIDVWASLALPVLSFRDVGLDDSAVDSEVWRKCQALDIVLITGNRNDDGPDSLESTIRNENTSSKLPVFTLANARRIKASKEYAKQIAEKMLEHLLAIENYRGVGRMFVP